MNVKKGIFLGVIFAFFVLGFIAIQKATPNGKEHRIYKEIKLYSPYMFEQTIGGLAIIDKRDNTKEKPNAADTLFRMDELDQIWGKNHLKVIEDDVIVLGENNQTVTKIFLQTPEEKKWVKNFFGI